MGYTVDYRGSMTRRIHYQLLTQIFLGHLVYTRPWGFRDESPCSQGAFFLYLLMCSAKTDVPSVWAHNIQAMSLTYIRHMDNI